MKKEGLLVPSLLCKTKALKNNVSLVWMGPWHQGCDFHINWWIFWLSWPPRYSKTGDPEFKQGHSFLSYECFSKEDLHSKNNAQWFMSIKWKQLTHWKNHLGDLFVIACYCFIFDCSALFQHLFPLCLTSVPMDSSSSITFPTQLFTQLLSFVLRPGKIKCQFFSA